MLELRLIVHSLPAGFHAGDHAQHRLVRLDEKTDAVEIKTDVYSKRRRNLGSLGRTGFESVALFGIEVNNQIWLLF